MAAVCKLLSFDSVLLAVSSYYLCVIHDCEVGRSEHCAFNFWKGIIMP